MNAWFPGIAEKRQEMKHLHRVLKAAAMHDWDKVVKRVATAKQRNAWAGEMTPGDEAECGAWMIRVKEASRELRRDLQGKIRVKRQAQGE